MKVFISWSGDLSKRLAEVLTNWLPAVIQAASPYYSPIDITKGSRWSAEISKTLEESGVGLICLTQENISAPWILFEAGALSKHIEESRVCPILFNVKRTDVQGPLVQFQSAQFEKTEMLEVVRMINVAVREAGEPALGEKVLDDVFDMWWPRLEEKINTLLELSNELERVNMRSERELLEEILELSRETLTPKTSNTENRVRFWNSVGKIVFRYVDLLRECEKIGVTGNLKDRFIELQEPIEYLVDNSRTDRFELQQYMSVAKNILERAPVDSMSFKAEGDT